MGYFLAARGTSGLRGSREREYNFVCPHMAEVTYRFTREDDCALILRFIRELADYEKMVDQVIATEDLLRE